MTARAVLGLDIGGANLKAAHTSGIAKTQHFALWKEPGRLASVLADVLTGWPRYERVAVTMTGELCDCFASRREGVNAILDAITIAAPHVPIDAWRNDGSFVTVDTARKCPLQVASANWLALAQFVGRLVPQGSALVVDIGSTTTDIVALVDGKPLPRGRTDAERLRSNELVYLGARRTPVNVLLGTAGAAEFFATIQDVFLVLGLIDEEPSNFVTPDGRPATAQAAHARLARMICGDIETTTAEERHRLAASLLEQVVEQLSGAITAVASALPTPPQCVVVAGSGEFLAKMALEKWPCTDNVLSLADVLGPEISAAACAHAVAVLASGWGG